MNATNRKFTYKDMEDCMEPLEDPASRKRFLATFQRQRGFPKPTAESKKLVNVAVELFHNDDTAIRTEIWKLPQGAISLCRHDRTFGHLLLDAYSVKLYASPPFQGYSPPCDCCKKPSNGGFLPRRTWSLKLNKVSISLQYACEKTTCRMKQQEINRKLTKQELKEGSLLKEQVLPRCSNCQKMEPEDGTKFSICGKCKLRVYCSEECQVQHWEAKHKKECKENFRGKLKRTSRGQNKK